jgi:hypothetical protein
MSEALIKLTVVAPADLETPLVEALLEVETPIGAFTSMRVAGHGESFADASTTERVSGRAARVMIVAIVSPALAKIAIERLKTRLHVPHAAWWVEPVLDFGKFQ